MLESRLVTNVDDLLDEAEQALQRGQYRDAYELGRRATQLEPHSFTAWLLRAGLSQDLEEKLLCVNRMNELGMEDEDRHHVAFFTLKASLDRDPFLAYMEETDGLYRVRNAERFMLSIPKRRSLTESYPDHGRDSLSSARRWLALSLFGLMFAGLGTLVFSPLAAFSALHAGRSANRSTRVDSYVILLIAGFLFLIGISFVVLLILHLAG